ncbi:MAG: Mu transposase C-terminal domain-containing protein [Cyanobacteria bacterium P01_E01_bin.35]
MSESKSNSLPNLSELPESSRAIAWERYQILRPHLEDGVPLRRAIADAGIPLRTAQRWVANYKKSGLAGLCRSKRKDSGTHKVINTEVKKLIEGLALQKPAMTKATIHRRVRDWCVSSGITPPSYETVYGIIRQIDPALMTLAHEGTKAYKQTFDLLHRHNAEKPNAIWQADHTLLDIWIKDEKEQPVRPWLTVIMDDYSRAIAGYYISLDAPSALQTALAFRQGIWRKNNPAWHICGIPEILYTDHGSDFTSHHIEQVCLDLKIRLIFSAIGEPRGRGKIERFFRTVNQLLLAKLPGYAPPGHKSPNPVLNFDRLDSEFERFLIEYHQTEHSQTKEAPQKRWNDKGFLPQLPESVEKLDLLLLTIKDTRRIRRDGIKFQGLRYTDPLLANYIGEDVSIRYDPRDLTEIRVYHQNKFLCRAICPDLSTQTVTLKEIKAARNQRRKQLKQQIKDRVSIVDALMGNSQKSPITNYPLETSETTENSQPSKRKLKRYINE